MCKLFSGRDTLQCFGPNSTDTINQIIDFDMFFKSTVNWHYDTTGSIPCPAGKYDFYTVALHELGHAHQITHVLDENKVMHYSHNTATQRRLTNSDVAAGINVVSYSIIADGSPCLPPMVQFFPINCTTDINEIKIENTDILLYPNPNNGSFTVGIKSESETHGLLNITNSLGQNVVEEKVLLKEGSNQYQLQFNNLKSGFYFVSFVLNNSISTKKLIIE